MKHQPAGLVSAPNGRNIRTVQSILIRLKILRFRLKTLLILVTLAAVACSDPAICKQTQFQKFKTYLNRDLQNLDEYEFQNFISIAKSVLARKTDKGLSRWRSAPWFLWEHPSGNLVFLQASKIVSIPGQSSARITMLNKNGEPINETEFSTGWRIDVISAGLIPDKKNKGFVFVINSSPVTGGRDVAKQYYSILGDCPILLRLEDSAGNVLENRTENHMIGPEIPEGIDPESIEMLKSQLAATLANAG